MSKDQRPSWRQAIFGFLLPLLLVFAVRWLVVEPFVIPSGSMIPSLLIYDHILVNKLAFGVSNPLTSKLTLVWSRPQRGEVVVFRYPENPDVFFIKRLIAVGGDTVEIKSGRVFVNSIESKLTPIDIPENEDSEFEYFNENSKYVVRYNDLEGTSFGPIKIEPGHYFMMGDNRNQSNDSRFWGSVPESQLVGKAFLIWLSCEQTFEEAPFMCDVRSLRWGRLFKLITSID